MVTRRIFQLVAGLLVLAALAVVAGVWPRVTALASSLESVSWLVVAGFAVSGTTALAACALAALLLWKSPDRPDARALTLFLAFLALFWGSLFRFLHVDATAGSVEVNLQYGSGWLSQGAFAAFLLTFAAFLRFSALFPERLTPERLPERARRRFAPRRWLRGLRSAFLRPAVVWGSVVVLYLLQRYLPRLATAVSPVPPEPTSSGQIPAALLLAFLAVILLLALYALFATTLGTLNLYTSYRICGPEERRRVQWFMAGSATAWWMVIGAGGLVALSTVLPGETPFLAAALPLALFLAPLVVVLGAAVGILYAGAIDPELALERSTIYGALGAVGLVTFAALENVLSEAVEAWLRLPGLVGSAAAGALVALVFFPLRVLVRRWRGKGRRPADADAATD